MKTNHLITLERGTKNIIIYVKDEEWGTVPDLSFIADVEVYETEENRRGEKLRIWKEE